MESAREETGDLGFGSKEVSLSTLFHSFNFEPLQLKKQGPRKHQVFHLVFSLPLRSPAL